MKPPHPSLRPSTALLLLFLACGSCLGAEVEIGIQDTGDGTVIKTRKPALTRASTGEWEVQHSRP